VREICDTSNCVIVWIWIVYGIAQVCVESYIGHVLGGFELHK